MISEPSAQSPGPAGRVAAWRVEWGVALAATATLVFFHGLLLENAGALWRDEVNSTNLASLPPGEFFHSLQFDSFPVLWGVLLRIWMAVGLGSTDAGLRVLGLILGLGVVAALWRNARAFGIGPPLLSLALLGWCAAVVAYGDSVRAYGLGMLTGILALTLAWEFAEAPTARGLLLFGIAAVVSVHTIFYNCLFLLSTCAGAGAVAARRRRWRSLCGIGCVGLASAVSLLLYREMLGKQKEWVATVRHSIGPSWIWTKFVEATASTSFVSPWLWVVLALVAVIVAALLQFRPAGVAGWQLDLVLFSGTALFVGVPAYLLFLLKLSYLMQPWYFLSLLSLAACCFEGVAGGLAARPGFRIARAGAAAALVTLALPGVWRIVHERKTNLDMVAAHLTASASKDDFIVISPWENGITFGRYYRGSTDWATIPPVSSHDLHRYDLLKKAMMSPQVMAPVLQRLREVLESGHRVWWVGPLMAPREGEAPPQPPVPEGPWGWREGPYSEFWTMQAGIAVEQAAASATGVPLASDLLSVSSYENPGVILVDGRRTR